MPDLDPVLAKVLYARGIDTPEKVAAFLADDGDLGNPFDLPDMAAAVTRLRRARRAGERIVVYGDFDVDGVSATALLVSALCATGADAQPYIPDRFDEAYGLNKPALQRLREQGASLVVTVDCGIRSCAEADFCREIGLDLIITDHHTVPERMPDALAVIDPKRADSRYPFGQLAGVGVAYMLVVALYRALHSTGEAPEGLPDPQRYLDLVALGTVADMVPLIGTNRMLARRGLARLRETARPGLSALMAAAGVRPEGLRSEDIAFRLGPRINAAGRLEHAMLAYRLLSADSMAEAQELAQELDRINARRQELLDRQVELARSTFQEPVGCGLLFVAGPDFHEGIVGLIASRLTEAYYRPALVMRADEEGVRGSARSIEGFHITRALDACADLLLRYGGHERAAGFSLAAENLELFRQRVEAHCLAHLDPTLLQPRQRVDAIVTLAEICEETVLALEALEPTGEENPPPLLATLGLELTALKPVGSEGQHLQLYVSDGLRSLRGIGFRLGHMAKALEQGTKIDVLYTPALELWQGNTYLQMIVHDVRPSR